MLDQYLRLRPVLDSLPRFDLPNELTSQLQAAREKASGVGRLTVRRDWLEPFTTGLGYVEEGLAASYYHLERVRLFEEAIVQAFEAVPESQRLRPEGGTLAFPSRPLTFEYQAFVFALRRTLEYLAGAIAAFFKTEGNRIKGLDTSIEGKEPRELSDKARARVREALPGLSLTTGIDRSVRDRLAHHESVDAGTFNVSASPSGELEIRLVGGGESLWFHGSEMHGSDARKAPRLVPVLEDQLQAVLGLLRGLLADLGLVGTDAA